MQAAQQVHGGAGWFQRKGEFPSARNTERPLAKEAQRYYQNGSPFLQRYLPFWLANLIDRMWPVLVTIVAVCIPLSRMVPPLYQFRVRSRIFRWYGQLRVLEEAIGTRPTAELLRELEGIEQRVERVDRAAELCRRALFAAHPHPDGRQPTTPSARRRGRQPAHERREPAAGRRHRLRLRRARGGAGAVARPPVEITLVDRTNHHLFQPLLYQVATAGLSAPAVSAPIRHVLRREMRRGNLTVLQGEVHGDRRRRRDVASSRDGAERSPTTT